MFYYVTSFKKRENMGHKRSIIKISIVFIAIAICVFLGIKYNLIGKIDIHAAKYYIKSYGHFAGLIFILFFSIRTLFIIFPYSIMVILGGNIFGFRRAFAYSMISVFISATFAFYISRFAGKDFVQKLLRGKMKQLDTEIERHGFKIIFFMRISTIFPFDILNFAVGLSKVRYRDFILGTILGIIPETFSLVYFGKNLNHPFSSKFYIAVIMLILTIAIPFTASKIRKSGKYKKSS